MLHQPGETGAGHVQGRTRALRSGPVVAKALAVARVHVPILSVLAIAIHGESYSVLREETYLCSEFYAAVVKMPVAPTKGARQIPRQRLGLWDRQRGLTGVPKVRQTTGRTPPPLHIYMYHGTDSFARGVCDRLPDGTPPT